VTWGIGLRRYLFDRIRFRSVRDAYLVRDKLAGLPIPDGYEGDACDGSDKIAADVKIVDVGAPAPTIIQHVEIFPACSEGMQYPHRQLARIEDAIPKQLHPKKGKPPRAHDRFHFQRKNDE
jgi:hypothetical protein